MTKPQKIEGGKKRNNVRLTNFHEWKQTDKRSKWNRHWAGKHTKECHEYSLSWCGDICKYTNEFLNTNTDLERINNL